MITNGKLVGSGYDLDKYHQSDIPRGNPAFVMSRSQLTDFARCPSKWRAGSESKDSDATEWGTLMDCLTLSPDDFDSKFAIKPAEYKDQKTGEMKPWNGNANVCKEWAEDHAGWKHVLSKDWDEAQQALNVLRAEQAISGFLATSQKQVYCTADWADTNTGLVVPLKILLDLVPSPTHPHYGKSLGDFKTARNAASGAWEKQINEYGYHVQAALYLDVYNVATGEERQDFRHIIQENEPPYQTAKRIVDQEFIEEGRRRYEAAFGLYCQCLKKNKWPDYDENADGIAGWAFSRLQAWMIK